MLCSLFPSRDEQGKTALDRAKAKMGLDVMREIEVDMDDTIAVATINNIAIFIVMNNHHHHQY
jgi:hypothetical protein